MASPGNHLGPLIPNPGATRPVRIPGSRGAILAPYSTGSRYGRNYDAISVRADTRALANQLRGEFLRVSGAADRAIKDAHERMADWVLKRALYHLVNTLDPDRASVNKIMVERHRGIRAALMDGQNKVVNSYGHFWGIGAPDIFARYGALDYYRVIERGGGFRGTIWGLMLDANLQATMGPDTQSSKNKAQNTSRLDRMQAVMRKKAKKEGASFTKDYFLGRDTHPNPGVRKALARFQTGAEVFQHPADRPGVFRTKTRRTGQPIKNWRSRSYPGAAAAAVATGQNGPWRLDVKKPIRRKLYMAKAMDDFMRTDEPRRIYTEVFAAYGIPWRFTGNGAAISGHQAETAAVGALMTPGGRRWL